jgi:hypothetical protein
MVSSGPLLAMRAATIGSRPGATVIDRRFQTCFRHAWAQLCRLPPLSPVGTPCPCLEWNARLPGNAAPVAAEDSLGQAETCVRGRNGARTSVTRFSTRRTRWAGTHVRHLRINWQWARPCHDRRRHRLGFLPATWPNEAGHRGHLRCAGVAMHPSRNQSLQDHQGGSRPCYRSKRRYTSRRWPTVPMVTTRAASSTT